MDSGSKPFSSSTGSGGGDPQKNAAATEIAFVDFYQDDR
jgi:hypothetical protein